MGFVLIFVLSFVDTLLMSYSIIVLDEAHERTVHTDVLFGIVKQAQALRNEKLLKPLKVSKHTYVFIFVYTCMF
jgi:HrpA-like RNA helicase